MDFYWVLLEKEKVNNLIITVWHKTDFESVWKSDYYYARDDFINFYRLYNFVPEKNKNILLFVIVNILLPSPSLL